MKNTKSNTPITDIRNQVSVYSSKMSAEEINEWNDMMQNPQISETELTAFLNRMALKY